ncbi:paraquat-inducible protein A [Photobacterium sagamiensis]|uniref:PqiA/YebS family transporter subunit n=1 Tax=Photobacterium sagamiensis TaxID=2910241 RepID=UPI003D1113CB
MTEHKTPEPMIACEECGLVIALPKLSDGQKAACPRCHHTLIKQISMPFQRPFAYGIACLIMLVLSVSFPFMSFSVQGITQEITLLHAAKMLQHFENSLLAMLLLLTVVVLPAGYITAVLYLYRQASRHQCIESSSQHMRILKRVYRGTFRIEPWIMVDVFLIGVLVSLIKIASLADVGLGMSFWAFCVYSMLVVKCVSMVDRTWLWQQFIPMQTLEGVKVGDTHMSDNHVSCHTCSQLNPLPATSHAKCNRCGSTLHRYSPNQSLQRAWALLIASAVFYIPANLYPIMYTVSLGNSEGSTILGGVVLLWQFGSYPIAMVIFLASVVIPLAKMFSLAWLYISAQRIGDRSTTQVIQRLRLYRMTELIGRWSMIDVFVVAILVALVQLHNLMAILPGPAALSFAVVVVFTMLSAMTFDPRAFWTSSDSQQGANDEEHINHNASYHNATNPSPPNGGVSDNGA